LANGAVLCLKARKDKKRRRLPGTAPEFAGSGNFVVVNRPGAVKMSEALMTLVEPEWHRCPNEEAMQKLLTMGVAAWNAALMQGAKRTTLLDELAQTFPADLRQDQGVARTAHPPQGGAVPAYPKADSQL
jgi:hypothetical protein